MEPEEEKELSAQDSLKLIEQMMSKVKDDDLWRIAKKRASFKLSFAVYILINLLLVCIWYFTTGRFSYFWPIWPILGWSIGLVFQFFDAYLNSSLFSEEKEFEKLKRKK
jgi:hypothetical protein